MAKARPGKRPIWGFLTLALGKAGDIFGAPPIIEVVNNHFKYA